MNKKFFSIGLLIFILTIFLLFRYFGRKNSIEAIPKYLDGEVIYASTIEQEVKEYPTIEWLDEQFLSIEMDLKEIKKLLEESEMKEEI